MPGRKIPESLRSEAYVQPPLKACAGFIRIPSATALAM